MSRAKPRRRWIVVSDVPFLPARTGGALEHLGFVEALLANDLLSALVIPTDADAESVGREDDLTAIRELVAPAPVLLTPRLRRLKAALRPDLPYVVASRPAPPELIDSLRRQAPDADAVLIFSYKSHRLGRFIAEGLGLPAVLRTHNLEGRYHDALAVAAPAPRRWAMRFEALRIELDERRLEKAPWLRAIADISISDAAVRTRRARVPVLHVPTFSLGTRTLAVNPPWEPDLAHPAIVFLGALDITTNMDAITWFAENAWPLVLEQCPGTRWQIVGRYPSAAVQKLVEETKGAELHANVPAPGTYLSAASVAINPAVSGSGVNIKVIDYLAAGAPIVSTERGTVGLGLRAGQDLLVEDNGEAFAAAVSTLLKDGELARQIGTSGRIRAFESFDTQGSLERLKMVFATPREDHVRS